MSEHGITRETLLQTLPRPLGLSEGTAALGGAAALVLADHGERAGTAYLYSALDALPEGLLDILAHDFKVDWWDEHYTLEEKRQVLRDAWAVHRAAGTKAAVERALGAIYPGAQVKEWYEYGGAPYHFAIIVEASEIQAEPGRYARALERVRYWKNLRSKLDRLILTETMDAHIGCGLSAQVEIQRWANMSATPPTDAADWLTDEGGTMLTDERDYLTEGIFE